TGEYAWSLLFGSAPRTGGSWPPWLRHDFLRLPFEALTHCYPDAQGIKRAVRHAFGTAQYNPIHKLLADEFRTGNLESVITTNYDLCLDAALEGAKGICTIWDEKSWNGSQKSLATTSRAYWKIHGTAASADSLIVRLQDEARMTEWKRKLLAQLINGK